MTSTNPSLSLSPVEIIVLSRLSCTKAPSEADIAKAVSELASKGGKPIEPPSATLNNLRSRRLIHPDRSVLTDAGHRALQAAFQMSKTPLWKDVHVWHLLACALDLQPGTEETVQATKDADAVARTYLKAVPAPRRDGKTADQLLVDLFKLSSSDLTLSQIRAEIADRVIRETLGLTETVSIARMRSHALARQASGNGHTVIVAGSKQQMLAQIAKQLGEPCDDKRSLRDALIRGWVYRNVQARTVESPRATAAQGSLAIANGGTNVTAPHPPTSLLQTVRDIIPRIGADGRFGPEKVFISALWRRLEHDRAAGLSLDRFKTWLIDANREQQIDLVRADLVGAMDPRLVAESEIEDLGATFHFVIDRQAANRRPHA